MVFVLRIVVTCACLWLCCCFYCPSKLSHNLFRRAKNDDIEVTTFRPDDNGRLPPAIERLLGIKREPEQPQRTFNFKELKMVRKRLNREKFERRVARQPHYAERFKVYNDTETIRRLHAKLAERFDGKKDLIAEAERRASPFKGFGPPPVYTTKIVEPRDQDIIRDENFNPDRLAIMQPIEVPLDVYERKPEDGKLYHRPTPLGGNTGGNGHDDDNDGYHGEEGEEDESHGYRGEVNRNEIIRRNGNTFEIDVSKMTFDDDYYDKDHEEDFERNDVFFGDREYDEDGNEVLPMRPRKRVNLNPKNLTRSGPLNVLGGYRFRKPPPVDPLVLEKQQQEEEARVKAEEKRRKQRREFEKAQYFPFKFKTKPPATDETDHERESKAQHDRVPDLDSAENEDEINDAEEEEEEKEELFVDATFSDLGITNKVILNNLLRMGVQAPTKIQGLVIPELLKGNKDVVIEAQTGSGKTLAFLLPLIGSVDPLKKKVGCFVYVCSAVLIFCVYVGTSYHYCILKRVSASNQRGGEIAVYGYSV